MPAADTRFVIEVSLDGQRIDIATGREGSSISYECFVAQAGRPPTLDLQVKGVDLPGGWGYLWTRQPDGSGAFVASPLRPSGRMIDGSPDGEGSVSATTPRFTRITK